MADSGSTTRNPHQMKRYLYAAVTSDSVDLDEAAYRGDTSGNGECTERGGTNRTVHRDVVSARFDECRALPDTALESGAPSDAPGWDPGAGRLSVRGIPGSTSAGAPGNSMISGWSYRVTSVVPAWSSGRRV